MKKLLTFTLLLFFAFSILAQNNNSTIVFYNVENLFDTIDDPKIKDDEFTPEGGKKWTIERYHKKLNDLAKVISSVDKSKLPDLVGFAEIENRTVLEDLVKTDALIAGKYKIVHEDSPDVRGIDVAMIYNPIQFNYVNHQKIPVPLETKYKVRDILYVKGILMNTDTLHIFVNHWKSRSGGQQATEPQRIQCAITLRNAVDSIKAANQNAKILVMGDLNDTPSNKSVFKTLNANNSENKDALYNLMLPLSKEGLGTHSYRGHWNILDHIIVSNNLVTNTCDITVKDKKGNIFSEEWITFTSKKGSKSPNRTYGGSNYYGGFSDHYPIYVTLTKQ